MSRTRPARWSHKYETGFVWIPVERFKPATGRIARKALKQLLKRMRKRKRRGLIGSRPRR
jgi:hypothetical protein